MIMSNNEKKKVIITVSFRPITNLSMGIILSRGRYKAMDLTISDIFNCICGRAEVLEVLPDGSTVKLDLSNYNKCNNKINDCSEDVVDKTEELKDIENDNDVIPTENVAEYREIDLVESAEVAATVEEESDTMSVPAEELIVEQSNEVEASPKRYSKKNKNTPANAE